MSADNYLFISDDGKNPRLPYTVRECKESHSDEDETAEDTILYRTATLKEAEEYADTLMQKADRWGCPYEYGVAYRRGM